MKRLGCLFILFLVFLLTGCSIFRLFESKPMATISVTMKTDLKAGAGPYQLKIRKIIVCGGYDNYLVLGEISKLPAGEAMKGQHLEDTVAFMGPVKSVQYFLVLTKEVQQELGSQNYPVIETEDGSVTTPEPGRSHIEDCQIYFIRP